MTATALTLSNCHLTIPALYFRGINDMYVRHSRIQHGVGQGSFHSATVEFSATGRHRFDYVFDCGALKYAKLSPEFQYALKRVSLTKRAPGGNKAVLDLMVLSHFDADHMNGAQSLVKRYAVDRIVLPYLGVEELALIIASQADAIDKDTLKELHGLANGVGKLWKRPVTMVKTGPRKTEERVFSDDPQREPPDAERSEPPRTQEFPHPVSVVLESTGAAPGTVMLDEDNLVVGSSSAGRHDTWKLRFWNRGLHATLGELILRSLKHIGFPVEALSDKAEGAQAIITWLDTKPVTVRAKRGQGRTQTSKPKGNRDLAIEAYREAITEFAPAWMNEASGDCLANFLSLGLYSGPGFRLSRIIRKEHHDSYQQYCRHCYSRSEREVVLPGWIGTGDAPLGEPGIWQDFERHYKRELPQTQTVVVPHHGAAPNAGARFYNPGLNHRPRVNAVISYAVRNSHGHPHPSVLADIAYAGGRLLRVTDDTRLGYQEIYLFRP